ncbi:hypothetical protein GCM10009860_21280 [Microbacterium mitrae]
MAAGGACVVGSAVGWVAGDDGTCDDGGADGTGAGALVHPASRPSTPTVSKIVRRLDA